MFAACGCHGWLARQCCDLLFSKADKLSVALSLNLHFAGFFLIQSVFGLASPRNLVGRLVVLRLPLGKAPPVP